MYKKMCPKWPTEFFVSKILDDILIEWIISKVEHILEYLYEICQDENI